MKAGSALDYLDGAKPQMESGHGRYLDIDADEYAVNNRAVHRHLDGYSYGGSRDGLDLYDIFRDFDRDGDGIVDDIDLDDPHWKESCNRNGMNPLDQYDDNAFRQGRYRGLTDEEWS